MMPRYTAYGTAFATFEAEDDAEAQEMAVRKLKEHGAVEPETVETERE